MSYFFALLLLGIPLLMLEGVIGHRWKLPVVSAYGKVFGNIGKTLGWMSVLACLSIGGFYIVLTSYSVAYTFFSATSAIPDDSKAFFMNSVLHISSGLTDFGQISLPIFFSTLAVSALTWFVLVRNVRDGIERVCTIFMPLLALIMVSFAIIITFLPGGATGWYYYLKPDFARLLEPALWRDVFGQLFFSLSLGLGIIIGYSRHTAEGTNIARAMIWMALGDFVVSFVAGFVIFGCLSHISYVQNIPFDSILTTDSTFDIGFILFPKIIKFFGPMSPIIGVIFFFCIFIAGITGVFSIVESIAGNIQLEFKASRRIAVTATIGTLTLLATLFCFGNASYIIDALVPMVMGTNMMIGGIALIVIFLYLSKEVKQDPIWSPRGKIAFNRLSLRYVALLFLAFSLFGNLYDEFQSFDLVKSIRWGWFVGALLISFCLIKAAERKLIYSPQQI